MPLPLKSVQITGTRGLMLAVQRGEALENGLPSQSGSPYQRYHGRRVDACL